MLVDFVAPFDLEQIKGRKVLDLGAGNGRFSFGLSRFDPKIVYALEPSSASDVIRKAIERSDANNIEVIQKRGDEIPFDKEIDYIFSIGVIHHILEPGAVVASAFRALKPGGRFIIWLYGYENNELYLFLIKILRPVTTRLPHRVLVVVSHLLNIPLTLYVWASRILPLPLHDYMRSVISNLTWHKRSVVIFDQLNPSYAKYYKRKEAIKLLEDHGFIVEIHHRRNYSWVAIGTKPLSY